MARAENSRLLEIRQLPAATGTAAEPGPEDVVAPGRALCLHFSLALENGELLDSNFDASPASCCLGDGNLLPGFEQALLGMRQGEEREVLLRPEQAFGMPRDENIQRFPRYRFPADLCLEKGLVLDFTDKDGNSQPGVVSAVDSLQVTIDFNHPLAGKPIRFRARIVQVGSAAIADPNKAEQA